MNGPELTVFQQRWGEGIRDALEQLAGEAVACRVLESGEFHGREEAHAEDRVWVCMTGSPESPGGLTIVMSRTAALLLAQLSEDQDLDPGAELQNTHFRALGEFFRNVEGIVAGGSSLRADKEAAWHCTRSAPPEWETAWNTGFRFTCTRFAPVSVEVLLDREAVETQSARLGPAAMDAGSEPGRLGVRNIDLLKDVELEVALRFGEREMLLRDILELDAGAVIELDRQINEPAELLVAGKLVARGEVVIVDGNYGLRVTEVVHPTLGTSLPGG